MSVGAKNEGCKSRFQWSHRSWLGSRVDFNVDIFYMGTLELIPNWVKIFLLMKDIVYCEVMDWTVSVSIHFHLLKWSIVIISNFLNPDAFGNKQRMFNLYWKNSQSLLLLTAFFLIFERWLNGVNISTTFRLAHSHLVSWLANKILIWKPCEQLTKLLMASA